MFDGGGHAILCKVRTLGPAVCLGLGITLRADATEFRSAVHLSESKTSARSVEYPDTPTGGLRALVHQESPHDFGMNESIRPAIQAGRRVATEAIAPSRCGPEESFLSLPG
jgi:hypothetical protein